MEFQEVSTQRGVSSVVSKISQRLTPFTEIAKWIFGVEIHGRSIANCSPPAPWSNHPSRPSETANVASELTSAHRRLPPAEAARGMASAIRKAARGRNRTTLRRYGAIEVTLPVFIAVVPR